MNSRKGSNRRKKGGMTYVPTNVETVGYGTGGCVFRDTDNNQLYKIVVPFGDAHIPGEVSNVNSLHDRNVLDRDLFVFPDRYMRVPVTALMPMLSQLVCKDVLNTVEHFQLTHVYIARMDDAGITVQDMSDHNHPFERLSIIELENVLVQLDTALASLMRANIQHNDLHPGNIAFTGLEGPAGNRNVRVHIIDFGEMKPMIQDRQVDQENLVKNVIPTLLSRRVVTDQGNVRASLRRYVTSAASLASIINKLRELAQQTSQMTPPASTPNTRGRRRIDYDSPGMISPHMASPELTNPQSTPKRTGTPKNLMDMFDSPPPVRRLGGLSKKKEKPKPKTSNKA